MAASHTVLADTALKYRECRQYVLLAAPWGMAARVTKSTSSSGHRKCSRSRSMSCCTLVNKRNLASKTAQGSTHLLRPARNGCKGNKEHQQLWAGEVQQVQPSLYPTLHKVSHRQLGLLAAPCAMAARAIKSTSSSGRGKCSRSGVLHLEKRNAASTAM